MKFCYFDESGMGGESYLVVAGVIVDSTRMHITKDTWADFLKFLSSVAEKKVEEFHSREFYRGNGIWRDMDGRRRANIINAVLDWVESRKHKCIFSGINKAKYDEIKMSDHRLEEFKSPWCAAAMHCTLQVQKQHQREEKNKGHSVLIFDREVSVETHLCMLINNPPNWIDSYYGRKKRQTALDQIVDVPFFADSKHILLAQIADLFAYILRTSAEIQDGKIEEKYSGERKMMRCWSERIANNALLRSNRYPSKSRCPATQLFWDLAPASIRELG